MADKLSIISDALALTGNNDVNVEEDGSDEWRVASVAYETGLETILTRSVWNFATNIAVLARTGDSIDERYADAFAKPVDCLHIRRIMLDGLKAERWVIVGNQICLDAGSAVTSAFYVRVPSEADWFPLFQTTLRLYVEAGLYRGLNEDPGEARAKMQEAEMMLQEAKTAADQQTPSRAIFRSRIAERRRGTRYRSP